MLLICCEHSLAGGVSFLGGLALWLSSLEVARRTNYEVFYKLHHIGEYLRVPTWNSVSLLQVCACTANL